MRQWIDQAGVNGEIGIEMMRESDPVRFRNQAQQAAVAIERPAPSALFDAQTALVVAVERRFRNPVVRLPVNQVDCLIADPVD